MPTQTKSTNITWHHGKVSAADREAKMRQRGVTVWFTGLSGSGKSTIARELEQALFENGHAVYVLDGDNVRHGLNRDLGFSPEDRAENIRRIGEVAALFVDSNVIALTAFISPYRADRDAARKVHPSGGGADGGRFLEVYVKCPIDECEKRDAKGLYAKARAGKIPEFTGVSAPYEEPENPDLVLETATTPLEECVRLVYGLLEKRGFVRR